MHPMRRYLSILNENLSVGQSIVTFLSELGIAAIDHGASVWVNRDDMVRAYGDIAAWPEEKGGAYDLVLMDIRKQYPHLRLFWAGKDDEYLWLEVAMAMPKLS